MERCKSLVACRTVPSKAIQDAKEAGANGFIMVDVPPEEAIKFRGFCTEQGYEVSCEQLQLS